MKDLLRRLTGPFLDARRPRQGSGFVYFAEGPRYVEQARRSIESLRKVSPKADVTVFTVSEDIDARGAFKIERVDLDKEERANIGKIRAIVSSPYVKTIFVDTDTIFLGSVDAVFDLLDHYDLAAALAPARRIGVDAMRRFSPEAYTGFNSGFVAFNLSRKKALRVVNDWEKEYRANQHISTLDQFSFNKLVLHSGARHHTLPPEYNLRVEFSHASTGRGMGAKVVHSHTFNEYDPARRETIGRMLASENPVTVFRHGDAMRVETGDGLNRQSVSQLARALARKPALDAIILTDCLIREIEKVHLFRRALDEIDALLPSVRLLQIGANDGNDDLKKYVERQSWHALLVEPQPEAFDRLARLHRETPNVWLVRAAIGNEDGTLALVRPRTSTDDDEKTIRSASGLATIVPGRGHVSRMEKADLEEIEVPALTFRSLLKRQAWDRADVLCIDTEGAEAMLLESYFNAVADGSAEIPLLVHYEERHLLPFEQAGLEAMLREKGYAVLRERFPRDTTAVHLATYQELKKKAAREGAKQRQETSGAIPRSVG